MKKTMAQYHHASRSMSGGHESHTLQVVRRKFWVCFLLTLAAIWFSGSLYSLLQIPFEATATTAYVMMGIGAIVFLYGGSMFIKGAWQELRASIPGMMTLISLAITTAFFYSVYSTLTTEGAPLWWELITLITIMLLGHWIEMRAVQGTKTSLQDIARLIPDTAEVIRKNGNQVIKTSALKKGDLVLIRPGSVVTADGVVLDGVSEVNESLITGESRPVSKKEKSNVIAGTINGDGALIVRVEKIGEGTFIAGIQRLIIEAENSKSNLQLVADRTARYITLIAMVIGAATLLIWLNVETPAYALERMVAVLVITCPHALGLAVPLVAALSTSMAARKGILIRQRRALELVRNVDTIVFDKTGTLTYGVFVLKEIITNPIAKCSEMEVLQFAASIDSRSEHPIAQAIVSEAKKRNIRLKKVIDFERVAGKGARAKIEGRTILLGGDLMLQSSGASLSKKVEQDIARVAKQGNTVIYVIDSGMFVGALAFGDSVRPEAKKVITELKKRNIETIMLTGDSGDVAAWVARELGIKEYAARVLPGEKAKKVAALQKKGHIVAMVGDGINDAPALTQADVGIAIGAGTDIAIESAGIILVKNDTRDVLRSIDIARATYRKMIQNIWWATGYNIVAIPVAAGIFIKWGWVLEPSVGAAIMSASTVIVAANALLLRRAFAKERGE